MIRVLGLDPGEKTFCGSVVDIINHDNKPTSVKLRANSFVQNTLQNLTNSMVVERLKGKPPRQQPELNSSLSLFAEEFITMMRTWVPNLVGFERFQSRPNLVTKTVESVSMMNGTLAYISQSQFGVDARAITAHQWKSAVERAGLNLEALYEEGKESKTKTPAHVIDSIGIGLYCATPAGIDFPDKAYRRVLTDLFTGRSNHSELVSKQ